MPNKTLTVADLSANGGSAAPRLLYLIESRAVKGPDDVVAALPEHRTYLQALEADGTLFVGGPVFGADSQTFSGDAMIVVRANSLDNATEIADADPLHEKGIREYTIRLWVASEGVLSITAYLSNQEARIL